MQISVFEMRISLFMNLFIFNFYFQQIINTPLSQRTFLMDSDVLTRILRTVSRSSVGLESQISEYLRLELGNAIHNVARLLGNTNLSQILSPLKLK